MEGCSALAIANYFLSKHRNTGISPLKIQKLTYIAHGWHLAFIDKPLVCDEYAEAWRYGPVFPSVYHEFKHRRSLPIIDLGTDVKLNDKDKFVREVPKIKKGDKETKALLDKVWEVYGTWSGSELSEVCHHPGTPWHKTWKENQGQRNAHIPNEVIKEYYSEKIKQNKRKNKAEQAEKLGQNNGARIEKNLILKKLIKKIKAVVSPKEKREFDTDSALDRVRYKLEKQKRHLRWFACFVVIATVFVFGFLEYGILQNIEFLSTIPGDLIFLVASPIFVVTAIVVLFLMIAFREM